MRDHLPARAAARQCRVARHGISRRSSSAGCRCTGARAAQCERGRQVGHRDVHGNAHAHRCGRDTDRLLIDERGEGWIAGYRLASFGLAAAVAEGLLMPWRLREIWADMRAHRGGAELFVLHNSDPKADATTAVDGGWSELRGDPAPWVFVTGPPLLLLIGFLGAGCPGRPRRARGHRRGAQLRPPDRLVGSRCAEAQADRAGPVAASCATRPRSRRSPVAVTGGWGTGKSSLDEAAAD